MINQLPDLNRLGVFFRVYQSASVSRAAEELHVTKSAVSQSIKKLEEEIGESLFLRKGSRIYPTEFAAKLFEAIAPLMATLAKHQEQRVLNRDELVGVVRIVAPPLFVADSLVPIIHEFRELHPFVRFKIQTGSLSSIHHLIEMDRIDFLIADSSEIFWGPRASYNSIELKKEPEAMVASPAYLKAEGVESIISHSVNKAKFVSYDSAGSDVKALLKFVFKRSPDQIQPVLVVDNVHSMLSAVRSSIGIGIVPISLIEEDLKRKKLIVIGEEKKHFENRMTLIWMERRQNKLLLAFRAELVRKCRRR